MKTHNKNLADRSQPIPNNLDSGTPTKTKAWKQTLLEDPRFISVAALILLCITVFLNEIWHLADLLRGSPHQPIDWIHFATEMAAILVVAVSFILILSVIRPKHKRAEEMFQESQEKFRTIFETANDVIVYVNTHGKILEVNEKVQDVFGYTRDEVKGKNFAKLGVLRLKDTPKILKLFKDAVLKGRVMDTTGKGLNTMELVLKRKDGSYVFVESSTTAVKKNEELQGFVNILRDITERKRAEEALRQSEEKFRQFASVISDVMYRYDPTTNSYDFLSSSFEEQTGYPLEEILSDPSGFTRKMTHPEDADRVFREVEDHLNKGPGAGVFRSEYRVIRKDGEVIWVSDHKNFEFGPGGTIQRINGVVRDITERKRAEEALKRERDFSQSMLETANSLIVCLDADAKITVFNQECERVTDYRSEEVLGKSWPELFLPPDQRHAQLKSFAKWIRAHPRDQYEGPIVTKSGEIRTILWSNTSILSGDDEEIVAIAIGHDITERKRAEEALQRSKEYFRIITENASDVVIIVDKKGTITYASPSIERSSGYKPEELIGKSAFDFIAPADLPRAIIDFGKAILTKETVIPNAFRVRHKDGLERVFEGLGKNLLDDPTVAGFVMNIHDISERKRAEEALRESEERYRNLFENSPIGIYRTTPDGRILMANPVLIRLLRFSSFDELASRNLEEEGFEATYPRSQFKEQIEREGEVRGLEAAWIRRDKSVIFVRENAKAIRREDGDVLYYEGTVEDITERKKAEDALKKERHRLFSVLDVLPAYVYVQTADYSVPFVNRKFRELFGDPGDRPCYEVFHGRSEPCEDCLTLRVLKTRAPQSYEWTSKDGRTYMIFEDIFPSIDGPEMVVEVGIDITERKRAEEALRESEEKYHTVADFTYDWEFWIAPEGKFIYVSPSCERITGYRPEEFLLDPNLLFKIAHTDERNSITDYLSHKESDFGEKQGLEFRILTRSGRERWIGLECQPVYGRNGEYLGLRGSNRDITEHKRAEEALRESEVKYSSLVEQAKDGVVIVQDNVFTFANRAMAEISGHAVEEIVGMPFLDMVAPESKDLIARRYELRMSGEKVPHTYETKIQCKDGTIRDVELTPAIIHYRGKPANMGVIRDITEEKKMEAQLIQAERLSAVGTLAYGIAHEFNNILAGILGNAEFGIGSDDPEEAKKCFQIIMESCDRAKGITNSLLAFSRQRETKKQRGDITEAVETVVVLVERELEKQNIKVVKKFSPIPEITCDLGELSGVVLNMITNARDAMKPKGGTLTIEIGKKKDNIEMIFTDTGCGIPDSIKGRIFEPFVTTKGALGQSEIPGTGLGLFLSCGIISRYHGEIGVKSEVGKGSRFTIKIPISENQLAPVLFESEEDKQATVPQNLNILLVDDEEPICTAIKKFFEAKGHSVTAALSGKKGLRIFKKGSFDLVLADITMPDMDGVELISKLKKIDQQMKFIVLTGHIAEDKLDSAKKVGADEILMKPFKNEELYQAIGRVLSVEAKF